METEAKGDQNEARGQEKVSKFLTSKATVVLLSSISGYQLILELSQVHSDFLEAKKRWYMTNKNYESIGNSRCIKYSGIYETSDVFMR